MEDRITRGFGGHDGVTGWRSFSEGWDGGEGGNWTAWGFTAGWASDDEFMTDLKKGKAWLMG